MARLKQTDAQEVATDIKVRLLRDCAFGKCNEVVTMSAQDAAAMDEAVDASPEAVAYAQSLAQ